MFVLRIISSAMLFHTVHPSASFLLLSFYYAEQIGLMLFRFCVFVFLCFWLSFHFWPLALFLFLQPSNTSFSLIVGFRLGIRFKFHIVLSIYYLRIFVVVHMIHTMTMIIYDYVIVFVFSSLLFYCKVKLFSVFGF